MTLTRLLHLEGNIPTDTLHFSVHCRIPLPPAYLFLPCPPVRRPPSLPFIAPSSSRSLSHDQVQLLNKRVWRFPAPYPRLRIISPSRFLGIPRPREGVPRNLLGSFAVCRAAGRKMRAWKRIGGRERERKCPVHLWVIIMVCWQCINMQMSFTLRETKNVIH